MKVCVNLSKNVIPLYVNMVRGDHVRIEWVNHASFILGNGNVRLISDPWLDGTAFDNGWSHLSETKFRYEDFEHITHIWFSHEHPDHFSPSNLKKIPIEYVKRITVLVHETNDKKVYEHCKKMGFREVIELQKDKWHQLSDDLKLLCNPFTGGDSWICFKAGEETIVNINDCVITNHQHVIEIEQRVGSVDVLLTQFSYANWVGNREDVQIRQNSAKEKLDRIKIQTETLKPRYTIPFASYVWFCHEDNYFMNDSVNKIGEVYEFVRNKTESTPIVLYPSEAWEVGSEHDSLSSIQKYNNDYARIDDDPKLIKSQKVDESELITNSKSFAKKLLKENNRLLLALFGKCQVFVTDYDQAFTFSLKDGLKQSSGECVDCDVNLSSDALNYFFMFPWGGGTLAINGRFQIPKKGAYWKFMKFGKVADINNNGESFNLRWLAGLFIRKVFKKV